jgi:UDP-N-acetylmuramyl tripeptide synthase
MSVINCGNDKGRNWRLDLRSSLTAGHTDADAVSPRNVKITLMELRGELQHRWETLRFDRPFVGKYNLENILCAAAVGVALHVPLDVIKTGLKMYPVFPDAWNASRMTRQGFVYVDFAHTRMLWKMCCLL